jgi:hypothetical protein
MTDEINRWKVGNVKITRVVRSCVRAVRLALVALHPHDESYSRVPPT